MNLARGLILSAVVLVAAVLWYLYQPGPPEGVPGAESIPPAQWESSPAPAPAAPPLEPAAGAPARTIAQKSAGAPRAAIRMPPLPAQPQSANVPEAEDIRMDLDWIRNMVRDYRSLFHENPVGNNAEIMQALMGGNKKGAQLGPPEGQKLNGAGELVDRWGTPYFFHQLSKTDMEIRSAGPDRVMWTADDQVTK